MVTVQMPKNMLMKHSFTDDKGRNESQKGCKNAKCIAEGINLRQQCGWRFIP